jgi:hypothetical protein
MASTTTNTNRTTPNNKTISVGEFATFYVVSGPQERATMVAAMSKLVSTRALTTGERSAVVAALYDGLCNPAGHFNAAQFVSVSELLSTLGETQRNSASLA